MASTQLSPGVVVLERDLTNVVNATVDNVAGIVGAGGNVGALLGNFLIIMLSGYGTGKASRMLTFAALGWGSLASSMLIPLMWIKGTGSMFKQGTFE